MTIQNHAGPDPGPHPATAKPIAPLVRDYRFADDGAPSTLVPVVSEPMVHEVIAPATLPFDEDSKALATLEQLKNLIRTRILQVVHGTATGFLLSGPGGLGKSRLVEETLKAVGKPYALYNSQVTARGLFETLQKHPTSIIVLEDMEHLFNNNIALGLLRSAFWSQNERNEVGLLPRTITWRTKAGSESTTFYGGLIIQVNGSLPNTAEMKALKTRISCIEMNVSGLEMRAWLRQIASRGYNDGPHRLSAEVCEQVCEFLLEELQVQQKSPNLRMLTNSFQDRCTFDAGQTSLTWQELVRSRITQESETETTRFPKAKRISKAEQIAAERKLLTDIKSKTDDPKEIKRQFLETTKTHRSTYYRRLADWDADQAK